MSELKACPFCGSSTKYVSLERRPEIRIVCDHCGAWWPYETSTPSHAEIADYEEAFKDHRRLVREIDVIISGEHGAAKQASLCDLISPIRELKQQAEIAGELVESKSVLEGMLKEAKRQLHERWERHRELTTALEFYARQKQCIGCGFSPETAQQALTAYRSKS